MLMLPFDIQKAQYSVLHLKSQCQPPAATAAAAATFVAVAADAAASHDNAQQP